MESDSDSDSTSSVISGIFAVGGASGGKGKEQEDIDNRSADGSRFSGETIREAWQEIATLFRKMTDAEEGRMVGFFLSVVSNVCRMESTQVIWFSCGLGVDFVAVGMDKIEIKAREVC